MAAKRRLLIPNVGRGIHSAPIHSAPTSSWTAEKTHGNFHTVNTSLFMSEYTIDIRYHPRKASGTLAASSVLLLVAALSCAFAARSPWNCACRAAGRGGSRCRAC